MTTALLYIRQSRNKPGDQTTSPEDQEAACRKLPAVAACEVVEVFSDLDKSGGSTAKRTGLRDFLARIEQGSVNVVAAYDQSRTFRKTADALAFYAFMEERPDIAVEFVNGRFDRDPVGGFSYTILAAAHELERKMTAAKRKAAAAGYLVKGMHGGGPIPYGFRSVDNGTRASHELELDPETAPVVRQIFERYANGETAKEITAGLTAVPPRGSAGAWRPDTVTQMLSNIRYNGRTNSTSRAPRLEPGKKRPEGYKPPAREIIPAAWPVLIEDGLFEQVQTRLNSWSVPRISGTGTKREFTFRKLLWCANCNVRFQAISNYGTRYYCGSREHTSTECDHAKRSILESELTPWFDNIVMAIDDESLLPLLKGKAADKAMAAEAIVKLDGRIERTTAAYTDGNLDRADYLAKLESLRRQRAAYADQAAAEPARGELESLAVEWHSGDPGRRHAVLMTLFDKLIITDRKISGYTPRADRPGTRLLVESAIEFMSTVEGSYGYIGRGNGARGI